MKDVREDFDKCVKYYTGLMNDSEDVNIVGSWGGMIRVRDMRN